MRKLIGILSVAVMVLFASCNKNEMPEFNDGDAFVSFGSSTVAVLENAGTVSIPVTLASVKGIATTVSYSVTSGTAVQGTNFTLADASATLSFNAENRTQNIVINLVDKPGVYTGTLKFTITLNEGDVKPSTENSCVVSIDDVDHPLANILGTYTVTTDSNWDGIKSFDMELVKDETDVTVVRFNNLVGQGVNGVFTGNVNEAKTQIIVSLGQFEEGGAGSNGDGNAYLYGCDGSYLYKEGNMIIKILADGSLEFDGMSPCLNAGGAGYYEILLPPTTAVKKTSK